MQPGQCPQNMQKCPDTYNPLNTVCMPLKTYFDMKTGKNIPEGRAATCADFQAPQGSMNTQTQQPTDSRPQWMMGPIGQMGPQMGPQMGTMNQGKFNFGQDSGPDYCQTNFNDPICKGGFGDNLKEMGQQYKFDMNQFDTTQFQMPMRDMKMELRDIKQETQGWSNDAKQVRQQLKEISRGSGGIACPTAVEADALATELENAVANVKSVLASSSTEDIQKALAIRDHINGRFDKMNDQQVLGIRQQLFGGPPDEDGNPTQGKMQGLNVCREITGAVYGACETQKRLSEDYTYMKEDGAPDEVLKVFEGVIGELKDRCQNPFSVLSKEGISLEELSQPFYPPDSCQGYGMGKFAPPMDQGSMNFMPPPMEGFQDMPEDMQRMIKEKMNNYGDQGQNNFQGFNPFGTSVLTAQGQPMMGRPPMGMGPMQIPDECKPPVQRYLGIDSLMLKLEDSRIQAQQGMESANICDMFKQGKKMLEKGSRKGPPQEARDLIEEGLTACENDDFETLEGLKFIAMDYMKREQMGNLVDPSELLKSKFKERIGRMRKAGSEEGTKAGDKALTSQLVEAERRLTELTAKLDEAQKTILALNEKMSEMATKLASAIELNDQSSAAVGNIARISDEMVQQTVAGTISDLADKADSLKRVVPSGADTLIDATINSLIQSPPSSMAVTTINESLTSIQVYAASGANDAEILTKVKEELANIAVTNATDVSNKVSEGLVAGTDAANFKDWYAAPLLNAKSCGFVARELTKVEPAAVETKCAAITRVARILEKTGDLTIDFDDTAPTVPGAPEWCLPFVNALRDEGVPFAQDLRDPNAPAERIDIAVLMNEALGDKMEKPENIQEYLTPDTQNLSLAEREAVANVRANGVMDTTDGTNFGPAVAFNRAQGAVVTNQAYQVLEPGVNCSATTSTVRADAEEDDFSPSDDEEELFPSSEEEEGF